MRLHELAHLHGGPETKLTQVITVLLEKVQNLSTLGCSDAFTLKHLASRGDVLHPEANRLPIMKAKIQVQAPRHERLEVCHILAATLIHVLLEIQVADEDEAAMEIIRLRHIILTQRGGILQP